MGVLRARARRGELLAAKAEPRDVEVGVREDRVLHRGAAAAGVDGDGGGGREVVGDPTEALRHGGRLRCDVARRGDEGGGQQSSQAAWR